ncbi:unnamed protein product [Cylindrotheca closterium]|uniref:Uncharacterized protein n=1 Tax=Cylindrotheca closterium TaxID=2856 RepID=A0AAD2G0B5_9STRA|nr:unnamed protein product [Cylindrotheca closterium]
MKSSSPGPTRRTDDGDDSPDSPKSRKQSKDFSHNNQNANSPIHKLNAIEEQVDIDASEGMEQSLDTVQSLDDDRIEQAPETDNNRVLFSEKDEAVSSPHKTNSTAHNSGASDDDDGTVVQENQSESDMKKRDLLFLKIVLGILLLLLLVAGIFLVYFFKQPTSTEEKLKELGYPYRKDMKSGWLFDASRDTGSTSYTHYNTDELAREGLGANEVDCASKCASEGAFAGAWNTYYQDCWCFLDVPNSNYCFERCIIEEGIEFSSIRLQSSFEWCPQSFCDVFDAKAYCDFRPKQNVTDCRE